MVTAAITMMMITTPAETPPIMAAVDASRIGFGVALVAVGVAEFIVVRLRRKQ